MRGGGHFEGSHRPHYSRNPTASVGRQARDLRHTPQDVGTHYTAFERAYTRWPALPDDGRSAEAFFAIDGVLNFTATMIHENGHDCLHLEVKIAEDRRVMPTIQAITAAVPYAPPFNLRTSTVAAIPPSLVKRSILDRRNHA